MVDCRLCKHMYQIWNESLENGEEGYKLVCMAKEVFIDKEYITDGPCDSYDDMDGYNPRE